MERAQPEDVEMVEFPEEVDRGPHEEIELLRAEVELLHQRLDKASQVVAGHSDELSYLRALVSNLTNPPIPYVENTMDIAMAGPSGIANRMELKFMSDRTITWERRMY